MSKISVIGAGSFGTALAIVAAKGGHDVMLWARDAGVVEDIQVARENSKYLPDVVLPDNIKATEHLRDIENSDVVLLVTPAQTTREMLTKAEKHIDANKPLLVCSKGLEQNTGKRPDEIVREWRNNQSFALLSGPGFFDEIAAGKPTAVTIAAPQLALAEELSKLLSINGFRPYAGDDVIGTALAGALKNPLAIGAGVIAGAGLGENARAAFITRGLAEITRLGIACGAKPATFMGLSGVGDVFLTCSSTHSRNYRYGCALAEGKALPTFTVEGLPTIAAATKLAAQHKVDMPLMQALHHLCYDKLPVAQVLQQLMARPLKAE